VERFEIRVSDDVLDDLRERLARTRFPDQLEGAGWSYGTELGYLRELVAYWRDEYDWRVHERALNRFDHYKTRVRDLDIHFIHQRSPEPNALPLLVTHGWPGSVYEFHKILGPLTDPVSHGGRREDAFHVVCPSMPGYGFSQAPRASGFDVREIAETGAALMSQLGYTRYGAQGGDWGSSVTVQLALLHPERLAGIHLNMVVAGPPREVTNPLEGLAPEEIAWVAAMRQMQSEETGYQRIQGTRPQTLGYALNDSPAGLAAWIVEKFRAWSDCGGDVESRFGKDDLLTNVMLYWVPQSITSSMRLYCETMRCGRFAPPEQRVQVPVGAAIFPAEIYKAPRAWAEAVYDIRRWTVMRSGGHFAALEEPEALVTDLREFFRPLRAG